MFWALGLAGFLVASRFLTVFPVLYRLRLGHRASLLVCLQLTTALRPIIGTADTVFASVSYTISGNGIENLTLTGTSAINATGNTNNVTTGYTPTLANLFVNGATETAATAFNAALLNSSFVVAPYPAGNFTTTSYVGAVRDANDLWYRGWTCDSGYASFGSNASCNTVPA